MANSSSAQVIVTQGVEIDVFEENITVRRRVPSPMTHLWVVPGTMSRIDAPK